MDTSIAAKEMLPIAVVAAIGARNGGVVQQNLTATMKPWFIHSWEVPVKKRTWHICCDVYSSLKPNLILAL